MNIYIAGTYDTRAELLKLVVPLLSEAGHFVTSRWLSRGHDLEPGEDEMLQKRRFAVEDMEDIRKADLLILMYPHLSSFGKIFEMGYAVALEMPVLSVGPRARSVFLTLPNVFYCAGIDSIVKGLNSALIKSWVRKEELG